MRSVRAVAWLLALVPIGATTVPQRAQPAAQVGDWSAVLDWPIEAIHAVMLPTGKVMVWQSWTQSVALWDPATGQFADAAVPNVNIFCSGHAWLPDGRLMVVGGHINNFQGEEEANIYDPWTDTWANNVPDMNLLNGLPDNEAGRWYPSVTTLSTGEVLTLSGDMTQLNVTNPLPQVYNPATNSWRDLDTAKNFDLPEYPRTFQLPDGDVVSLSSFSGETQKLSVGGTGSWAHVDHTLGANDLWNYGPAVMYDAGKVAYFGGGEPNAKIRTIDFNDPDPQWAFNPQDMAFARRQNDATILADGTVLITGGTSAGGFNNSAGSIATAEIWDPVTRAVTAVDDASDVYRGYHSTATLLPDGTVLVTGGDHDDGGGFVSNRNAEIYSPPYLFNGPRPAVTAAPATAKLGDTIFVETPDAASITKALMIVPGATTHAQNWTQRANVLDFTAAAGGIHIDLPDNPNHAPPGNYMLFLVNDAGVPSVAEWLMAELPIDPPTGVNLLDNAGFNGSLDDWGTFGLTGSNISTNSQVVKEGSHALKLYPQFSGVENYTGVFQGVAVTEGDTVRAEASARVPSWDTLRGKTNEVVMKIEFYSLLGGLLGSADYLGEVAEVIADGNVIEDRWFDHVLEAVAPAGAVEARLVFSFVQPFNDNGAVWIDDAALFATAVALIGDYNGNGLVEQGDLNLVLSNWGVDATGSAPAGWVNDAPDGLIEQTELNRVLNHWGAESTPDFGGASVPEPTAAVGVLCISLGVRRRRKG